MVAITASWERALQVSKLSLGDDLEMEGHSAVTLGRDYTVTVIHIMVRKHVSLCETCKSISTTGGNLMT